MGGKLLSIRLIEIIVNLYDFITLPVYYLIQQPWKVEQLATKVRARQVEPNVWINIDNKLDKSDRKSLDTLDQLFSDSVENYATRRCLGVRKILAVEYKDADGDGSGQANGAPQVEGAKSVSNHQQNKPATWNKVISKYVLDDHYTWWTYGQIGSIVVKLSAGLVNLCEDSLVNRDGSRKLLICADTCMQWFLTAHACFRNNVTVVTAYTTLDDEAILHIVQQTEVRILVVSQKFCPRLTKILAQTPLVDTLIVLDEPLPGVEDELDKLKHLLGSEESNVKRILSYNDLLARGESCREKLSNMPKADDIAVLMYTSGSTGKAKGVMLSHKSIVYTALAFSGPGDISHEDRYIGYLPLGHVLELAAECIFLRNGSTIAYSSPLTLTSASPMIKKGQQGDASIFKPTIMGAVPLVLDRIRTSVQQAVKKQGPFYDQLINEFLINYKRYWWERYYSTPILDLLICRKFNMIMGGKIRAICSGGAALSRDTQEYLRFVTNYTVLQGYGLTETSAAASFCDIHDRRCNVVGPPYPVVRLKLESWSDYSTEDKPNPRGEIIIGGQPVSSGYYKMDELTRESFYVEDGVRYFRTGDIGMMLPDGCLKIIDRKKDIVKPLSGEYISLSQIESTLRTGQMVENICVYCSQYSNYVVALIRPQMQEIRLQAKEMFHESSASAEKFRELIWKSSMTAAANNDNNNQTQLANGDSKQTDNQALSSRAQLSFKSMSVKIIDELSDEALCSNQWLVERILRRIQDEGKKKGLKRTQIPSRIKLCCEDWSPESGLTTASFKLRRRELERYYADAIKQLYAELGQKIDQDTLSR